MASPLDLIANLSASARAVAQIAPAMKPCKKLWGQLVAGAMKLKSKVQVRVGDERSKSGKQLQMLMNIHGFSATFVAFDETAKPEESHLFFVTLPQARMLSLPAEDDGAGAGEEEEEDLPPPPRRKRPRRGRATAQSRGTRRSARQRSPSPEPETEPDSNEEDQGDGLSTILEEEETE